METVELNPFESTETKYIVLLYSVGVMKYLQKWKTLLIHMITEWNEIQNYYFHDYYCGCRVKLVIEYN